MSVTKSKNVGKWFEGKTNDILMELRGKKRCTFVRLYDSYAAQGNMLGNQPGDFIVVPMSLPAILVECKSSMVHPDLRSCLSANVEDHQGAAHRIWDLMGGDTLFLFYTDETDEVEFWCGDYVGEKKAEGKPLNLSRRLSCVPMKKFNQALKTYISLGVKK